VHFNLHVFRDETGRQETLNRMVATILHIQSALNFFVDAILLTYAFSGCFTVWKSKFTDFWRNLPPLSEKGINFIPHSVDESIILTIFKRCITKTSLI